MHARIPSAEDADSLINVAELLADAASVATLQYFRAGGLSVDNKGAGQDTFDPVTEGDRAAEDAMRAILAEHRPDDGVLGEELGHARGSTGLTWVLDPIDGTRAYLAGAPTWGTLIAVCDETGPILGLIEQPYTRERWRGGLGKADLRHAGRIMPLATRATSALEDALLCTTFPEIGTAEERRAFEQVAGRVRLTRYGLDCYAYGLIASGGVDLVIEAGLHSYDVCGPIAVIEAAGGIVTNWEGGRADQGGRILAAANAELHRAALDLLHTG